MKLQFNGKNVLVLGGSCDLALALAAALMDADLQPLMTYRSETGKEKILERLPQKGNGYRVFFLDFGDRDSLTSLLAETEGDIDYVVDFVQGDFEGFVASADEEKIYPYFADNVSFRAELLKKIGRIMMKKKRGRFVFVSSVAAGRTNPGQGFYAAAKLASEALYRNLGLELGARGITTVTLRPGYIKAGRGKTYLEAHGEDALKLIPTKRFLQEREVAETILFLLSESAGGFNATEITMDGGMTACK